MAFCAKRRKLSETSMNGGDLSQESDSSDYREKTTCFSDPAANGGQIELNEACVKVIKTVEFGRLHDIKQTGGCYLVYPSAKHARFEHSLGTCYLAGEVLKRLNERQPKLHINSRDRLAVELAALCHDLGHGALSHTFDQLFIPLAVPESNWTHEDASKKMFRYLLEKNPSVKEYLDRFLQHEDYVFIEEAITPVDEKASNGWPYKGRPIEKAFLYDIVSNKAHGFDVDKWDYIVRDAFHMSFHTNANLVRLLMNLRVIPVGRAQRPTICYRDKVRQDLANLAETRAKLHASAYQHLAVKKIEVMMVDALLIADKHLRVPGSNGAQRRISESISDMTAYCHITDDIFGQISCSTAPELKDARDIMERIAERRFYANLAQVEMNKPEESNRFQSGICSMMAVEIATRFSSFKNDFPNLDEEQLQNNLVVMVSDIHGGMKDKNPVANVWFYKKEGTVAFKYKKRHLKSCGPPPRQKTMRVFCRKDDEDLLKCARLCFESWCKDKGLKEPRDIQDSDDDDDVQYASQPNSVTKDTAPAELAATLADTVRKNLSKHTDFQGDSAAR